MDDDRHREAVRVARERLGAGDHLDDVLRALRASGLDEIPCIKVTREVLSVSLGQAKMLVHLSGAFADRREEHESIQHSLVDALREINEINEIEAPDPGGPARQLGDFRAALAFTLRMIRRQPGVPMGLTILSVPTDGEIIREVRRLRELADQAEVQLQSTATDLSEPSNTDTDHPICPGI